MLNELLILYLAAALGYFLLNIRSDRCQTVCELFIILLLPGIGIMLLLVVRLLKRLNKDSKSPAYLYEDFKRPTRRITSSTQENESDILPISDVLLLDDAKTKRAVLGGVIKRDLLSSREALFTAAKDQDSEVSHYAVSVVTQRLAELEASFYDLRQKRRETLDSPEVLQQYAEVINSYLQLSHLDKLSQARFEQEYTEVLEALISLTDTRTKYFTELINNHLKTGNYERAEYICKAFLKKFPYTEEPYLQTIKLYYCLKDYQSLQQTVEQLKKTNIKFTNQALQAVRFWDGGYGDAS